MTHGDRPSQSAKILAFPGRSGASVGLGRRGKAEVVELRPAPAPVIIWGSGWYHEAAVQDASASRPR